MSNIGALIKAGDAKEIRKALSENPGLAAVQVEGAPSPILLAVYHGKGEIADALRQAKPDIDVFEAAAMGDQHRMTDLLAQDPSLLSSFSADGFTPLGLAAFFGHREMVRLLLNQGADPNVSSRNHFEAAPLHSALANGHKEIARLLIDAGADVNAVAGGGWTPLHYAAYNGDIETAQYLLEKCALTDAAREDGKEPAEVAEERGFSDLGEILRPKGA